MVIKRFKVMCDDGSGMFLETKGIMDISIDDAVRDGEYIIEDKPTDELHTVALYLTQQFTKRNIARLRTSSDNAHYLIDKLATQQRWTSKIEKTIEKKSLFATLKGWFSKPKNTALEDERSKALLEMARSGPISSQNEHLKQVFEDRLKQLDVTVRVESDGTVRY